MSAWALDWQTWGWIGFIAFFIIWEAITIASGGRNALTHHLQDVFHAAPVTWYIGFGLWLWMGPHFLFPLFERWWSDLVGRF